jgi:hypothetical protein
VPSADELVRDREAMESSGMHDMILGLLAELLAEANTGERVAVAGG